MTIEVFGYGSLMYLPSLRATAPGAKNVRPGYIKGFKRSFDVFDAEGWTQTNLDVAGQGYCALNVVKVPDEASRVNGILFSVDVSDFKNLQKREAGYYEVQTKFFGEDDSVDAVVFSSKQRVGKYDSDSPAQRRYLDVCLQGAKEFGDEFYQEFLETTYIDKVSLSKSPALKNLK